MARPTFARPQDIGFDAEQLQRAHALLQLWCEVDKIPAATLCVGRKGEIVEPRFFGRQAPEKDAGPLRKDSLFLVASITKPVTVTAVMMLIERGEVMLSDRVAKFVPAFAAEGKSEILVRHLMTHSSGLPDMLPDNIKLRMAHKPLSAFIEATCALKPLYPPGTQVGYQSMGTAMLGEIVHQVTGKTIQEFLRQEIFDPLDMKDTSLGWQPEKKDRLARVRVPKEMVNTDWGWMSPYWLALGAPWGGLVTSPADFARFCLMTLGGGALGKVCILSPASIRTMTSNQLAAMPNVPEEDRRCKPWGLGWRLNWPGTSVNFGDLLGPRAFGHWGATGTVCWLDPDTETLCLLFTTQPQEDEGRYLARICNMVAAAVR
jgi:CubicO group peptidase (beta-lactamase class C family)